MFLSLFGMPPKMALTIALSVACIIIGWFTYSDSILKGEEEEEV